MIFNERHTDDDTLILPLNEHFTALISTSCKKYSRGMFEEAGFLVYVQEVTYEDPSHEWTQTINLYMVSRNSLISCY